MTLAEWNNRQIQEAFSSANREHYFDETGNLFPTNSELIIFYIEHNAVRFQEEHQDDD